MNRPTKRNAINREMANQLNGAIDKFENDESAKICVLYGNGGSFSAGYDMNAEIEDSSTTSHTTQLDTVYLTKKNKKNY